ncbi:excalibur calcium-binding domain-containing protein [soil metagenome]
MVMRALFIVAIVSVVALGGAVTANAAPFVNCSAAEDAGYQDIPSSSEYYGPHLDRDQDGIGCES